MNARGKILALVTFTVTFFYLRSPAQGVFDWRSHIDMIVEQTDSLSLKSQRIFYLDKLHDKKLVKETWYYTLKDDKVVIFEVRYLIDSVEYLETYYLDKGRLICMEQYKMAYYASPNESIQWGEVLFFHNNTLKQYVTIGQRKSGYGNWDLYMSSLENFNKRYSELQKNLWH